MEYVAKDAPRGIRAVAEVGYSLSPRVCSIRFCIFTGGMRIIAEKTAHGNSGATR